MPYTHKVAGAIPAFPTDVEIGVMVNITACGAVDMSSILISQPQEDKWQTWCMRPAEDGKKVIRSHSCPPEKKGNTPTRESRVGL